MIFVDVKPRVMNSFFRKFYLLIALAVFTAVSPEGLYAQFPLNMGAGQQKITGRISGTVLDSVSGTPVEFATISIKRAGASQELGGTLTGADGGFRLDNMQTGKYEISISFLGYKDLVLKDVETTGKKPDLNLGKLQLAPSELMLKEVVIEGQSALIENKVDRMVYNAEKDITIAGGDASDVLRKVPMLSVDLDGNPSLRGSSNVRVLINGKPSGAMAGSVSDALKMIPADEIKSIEVITSPSAKYDAEGTGGIINIITKKKTAEGINASLNGGVNTRNAMLFGSLGMRKGRLGINTSLGGNYFIPQGGFTEFRREETKPAGLALLTQDGQFIGGRNTYNASLSADYDINAYNNLSSSFRVNSFGFTGDNELDVVFIDPEIGINQAYSRDAVNKVQFTNFDWTVDYRKTFKKPQQEFSASSQISKSNSVNRYTLQQYAEMFPDLVLDERSFNDGTNIEWTMQADYVHPFTKSTYEAGAKAILRDIGSDFTYELRDPNTGAYIPDAGRGNVFGYGQDVYSLYNTYSHKLSQTLEIKGGFRWELTDISGTFTNGEVPITNRYSNYIPSFTISKALKNFRSVKLNYTRRIQRPSLFFLNPFVNESDPRNISQGNPYLGPEESDLVEAGYNGFFKNTAFNVNLYYRYTKDVIQSYIIIREDGVSVNSFDNIGYNSNMGVNLFGQIQFFNIWTVRGSVNAFYVIQNGVIAGERLQNNNYQYNIMLNTTLQLKDDWIIEAFGLFNSPRVTLQGSNPAFSIFNVGFKKQFWNKKASLGLNITNPFTPYLKFKQDLSGPGFYQYTVNAIPFRAVGINFSYQFGKMEFRNPMQRRKGVNNEDLKQGEGNMNF